MTLQGGRIRIEIGFAATVDLQEANPFTLDDPVLGLLDFGQLPGAPIFVDVSEFFQDGLQIVRGRNRSVNLFTAGRASFRLDNRDRTFDPTNTDSPFFGQLGPMRPVRIYAVVGMTEELLFQGFVTDWNFRYERPSDAWVDVDCVDAFVVFASDDLPAVSPVGDEDTSDVRVNRILDAVGFGTQRQLTAGRFSLAATDLSGNALAQMERAAASDSSLLFMSREGDVTLLNPITVFGSLPVVTLTQANVVGVSGIRYHDVELQTAAELLYNRVNVIWDQGTVVRQNADSVARFLPRTLTIDTDLKNENDAQLIADYALARFSSPELRLRSVTVKLHDRRVSPADRLDLCRIDVGQIVTVARRPPGVGNPIQVEFQQVVEGLSWRYARESWTVSLQLGDVVGAPFILDDPALGALDTGGILVF